MRAFNTRDITLYEEAFTPDLEYTQLDGVTIGRSELMRNVREQFTRMHSATSDYTRQSLDRVSESRVTEVVAQEAWIKQKLLFVVKKRWKLRRVGTYSWRKDDDRWRIEKVVIHTEEVS